MTAAELQFPGHAPGSDEDARPLAGFKAGSRAGRELPAGGRAVGGNRAAAAAAQRALERHQGGVAPSAVVRGRREAPRAERVLDRWQPQPPHPYRLVPVERDVGVAVVRAEMYAAGAARLAVVAVHASLRGADQ